MHTSFSWLGTDWGLGAHSSGDRRGHRGQQRRGPLSDGLGDRWLGAEPRPPAGGGGFRLLLLVLAAAAHAVAEVAVVLTSL